MPLVVVGDGVGDVVGAGCWYMKYQATPAIISITIMVMVMAAPLPIPRNIYIPTSSTEKKTLPHEFLQQKSRTPTWGAMASLVLEWSTRK